MDDQVAPETKGVTVELLALVDLASEIEAWPGASFECDWSPSSPEASSARSKTTRQAGTVCVLQGTITDHRDGIVTEYGPGLGWPEDRKTLHWVENRGTVPAVEVSVDIVRQD